MSDINLDEKLENTPIEVVVSPESTPTVNHEAEALSKEFADKVFVLESSIAEKDLAITTYAEQIAQLKDALTNQDKELADMHQEMVDMKKKEKNRMRKEKLVMAGFEEAEAEESLSLYDALADEAFEAIVAIVKKKMANKHSFKENMYKDEKDENANPKAEVQSSEVELEVSAELFEEMKSTEATLVDASDVNDELETTRASVAEWLTANVLRK